MSRSVSAPASVTKTSPCRNGFIVPGSTLRYGSNFCIETRKPRATSSLPRLAAVRPLPSQEATPPVTKRCLVNLTRGPTGLQPIARPAPTTNDPPSRKPEGAPSSDQPAVPHQQLVDHLILIRPGGGAGQSGRTQGRPAIRIVREVQQLFDGLPNVEGVEQHRRVTHELLDATDPGAEQGHPGEQSLLCNQSAGFPHGREQGQIRRAQQRGDVVMVTQQNHVGAISPRSIRQIFTQRSVTGNHKPQLA